VLVRVLTEGSSAKTFSIWVWRLKSSWELSWGGTWRKPICRFATRIEIVPSFSPSCGGSSVYESLNWGGGFEFHQLFSSGPTFLLVVDLPRDHRMALSGVRIFYKKAFKIFKWTLHIGLYFQLYLLPYYQRKTALITSALRTLKRSPLSNSVRNYTELPNPNLFGDNANSPYGSASSPKPNPSFHPVKHKKFQVWFVEHSCYRWSGSMGA